VRLAGGRWRRPCEGVCGSVPVPDQSARKLIVGRGEGAGVRSSNGAEGRRRQFPLGAGACLARGCKSDVAFLFILSGTQGF
jgi:hypothetical protein